MSFSDLPALNACLNGLSAVLLTAGFWFIRKGNRNAHRNCMIAAFTVSALFLISYITYHLNAPRTVFRDPEWFRPIYLGILLTHTVLAAAIVPMALATLYFAVRQKFDVHRKIARWTWPAWMYVSITGVVIYLILYQIYPQPRDAGGSGMLRHGWKELPQSVVVS